MARPPKAVWAVVALHGLLLVVTSVVYPTYRAADESAHVDMVLAVGRAEGYPAVGERRLSRRVVASYSVVGYEEGRIEPLAAAAATPRAERPAFAELGPDSASRVPQQMAAHPPLYYVVAAAAVSTVTALVPAAHDWPFDQLVGFLRLLSAALLAPLPWLAYRCAERLRAPAPVALTAALVPLAIPGVTHVGAAVTNDALLVTLMGVLTVAAVSIARGDLRRRTALGAGLVAGLALLTKGFALFVPALLLGAYALAAVRHRRWVALARGAVALVAAAASGGWWWIRNLVVAGTVQPAGLPSPAPPTGFSPDVWSWLPYYLGRLNRSFWFGPDLVSPGTPPIDLLATGVLVVVCVVAFAAHRAAGQAPDDLGILLVPLAGVGAIVTFGAWRVYARSGLPLAIHGRYLYSGVAGMAVLAALGAGASARDAVRWLPLTALAAVTVMQGTAWGLALSTYWAPPAGPEGVAAVLAWSPWPAALTVLALAAATGLAAGLASTLLGEARTQGARSPGR